MHSAMATSAVVANGIVHTPADALGTTTLGTAAIGTSIGAAAIVTNAISTSSGTSVANASTILGTTLGNVAAIDTSIGTSVAEANGIITPDRRSWSCFVTRKAKFHRASVNASDGERSFHSATSNPRSESDSDVESF